MWLLATPPGWTTPPQPLLNLHLTVSGHSKTFVGDRETCLTIGIKIHRVIQPISYCQLFFTILNLTNKTFQDAAGKWLHPVCEDEENQTRERESLLQTKWPPIHWEVDTITYKDLRFYSQTFAVWIKVHFSTLTKNTSLPSLTVLHLRINRVCKNTVNGQCLNR